MRLKQEKDFSCTEKWGGQREQDVCRPGQRGVKIAPFIQGAIMPQSWAVVKKGVLAVGVAGTGWGAREGGAGELLGQCRKGLLG